MQIVVAGHVDHGKSTVVGRLLADTGSLPDGKLEQVRALCARTSRPFEYAFLLDALKDEQAQGITIDSARVFFSSQKRQYVIIDAPGHLEFLKNMVSGAARAEAAFVVVDAREGVRENSRRHGYLLSLLGVRQVAVLVNKMDLVNFDRAVFERLAREYTEFLASVGVAPAAVIPISGYRGDNLVRRTEATPWYAGPTALEALDAFRSEPPPVERPFRMPVQAVYKFTAGGDDRRIVAGTIEGGTLRVGDEVVFHPSGKRSRVRSIEAFNRPAQTSAEAGAATGFTLEEQIYVARGQVAARAGEPAPQVGDRLAVSLFWLGRRPLLPNRDYVLKLGTARVVARLEELRRVVDAAALQPLPDRSQVERHEVAEAVLRLAAPIACDLVDDASAGSRFVLLDEYEISGGGIVRGVERAESRAPEPCVVWLTGLSGAGKSTIAERVVRALERRRLPVESLDGDAVRELFPATGFSKAERDAHVRRVGYLASRLEHHGVFVVASFVSPYAESRDFVRRLCRNFIEVHVATPLAECERRDAKGLYARARRGEVRHFTGLDDPYQPPINPELRIDTSGLTPDEAAHLVVERITRGAGRVSHGSPRPDREPEHSHSA